MVTYNKPFDFFLNFPKCNTKENYIWEILYYFKLGRTKLRINNFMAFLKPSYIICHWVVSLPNNLWNA